MFSRSTSFQCFNLSTMPRFKRKVIILDNKSQEAASAASWECLKNFSFLLLQNMVRADVFNRFFGSFYRCGSPIPSASPKEKLHFPTGQAAAFSKCRGRESNSLRLPLQGSALPMSYPGKNYFVFE